MATKAQEALEKARAVKAAEEAEANGDTGGDNGGDTGDQPNPDENPPPAEEEPVLSDAVRAEIEAGKAVVAQRIKERAAVDSQLEQAGKTMVTEVDGTPVTDKPKIS